MFVECVYLLLVVVVVVFVLVVVCVFRCCRVLISRVKIERKITMLILCPHAYVHANAHTNTIVTH